MKELKNYMIVHKNEFGEVEWSVPNLELPIDVVVKSTCRNNEHYVLVTSSFDDIRFLGAYGVDFNLPSGSISPISIDIEIAKDMYKQHIRDSREKLFPDLDVKYMKALETGNQTKISEIVSKKQQLRDLTNMDVSDATTLVELKNKWPTEILGNSPYEN
jgi:hypothetical protein